MISMAETGQENKIFAVCGKGGSGKTALVALMTKHIIQGRKRRLLVIDADPTMNLSFVLGLKTEKTINDIREKIISEARSYDQEDKENLARSLDYLLFESLLETDDFSFLVMGRPDSLGCYCPVNDFLRDGIETLAGHFDMVLIDGEAGVEQINRQVMRSVDVPIIVSDISNRGLRTAALIKSVIESHDQVIKYQKMGLVLNRVRDEGARIHEYIRETGLTLFGIIPEDENITRFDMEAEPLLRLPEGSPAYLAVGRMLRNLNNEIASSPFF